MNSENESNIDQDNQQTTPNKPIPGARQEM